MGDIILFYYSVLYLTCRRSHVHEFHCVTRKKGFSLSETKENMEQNELKPKIPQSKNASLVFQDVGYEAKPIRKQSVKPRNHSFVAKPPDRLDSVEMEDGTIHVVPARPGSTYWAILRIMYESFGKPVRQEELTKGVESLMQESHPERWDKYKAKTKVVSFRKTKQLNRVQQASNWRERIIGNAKTLTRQGGSSPYGLRLIERGHCLKYTYDHNQQPYFILKNIETKKDG